MKELPLKVSVYQKGNEFSIASLHPLSSERGELLATISKIKVEKTGSEIRVSNALIKPWTREEGHVLRLVRAFHRALIKLHEETGHPVFNTLKLNSLQAEVRGLPEELGYPKLVDSRSESLPKTLRITADNLPALKETLMDPETDMEAAEQIKNALKHCLQRVNE